MRFSPKDRHYGIEVFDFTPTATNSVRYFEKIKSALNLIREYQPHRLARISRDVCRILVVKQAAEAEFWPALKACVLTCGGLELDDDEVALMIVHEAVHARIDARGIPYSRKLRERIEMACICEEIAFAELLPNGAKRVSELRDQTKNPWWSNAELFDRRLSLFQQSGAPEWLVRGLRAIFTLR
jgi:hypothetical protein